MKIKFLLALTVVFIWGSNILYGQGKYDAEHEIGIIVAVSLRFGEGEEKFIDSLVQLAKKSGDEKWMAYGDFINKAWHRVFDKVYGDEKERQIAAIDHIAQSSKFIELRGHALLWQAEAMLLGNTQNEKGLLLTLKGKKLLEEANYEQSSYAIYYYCFFMVSYSIFEDYKNAIHYSFMAINCPDNDYYGMQSRYNDLGIFYKRTGQLDSAFYAFRKSAEVSRTMHLKSFEAMATGNIGDVLRLQKKYREAIPYLQEGIEKTENEIPEAAALNKLLMADCLLHLDSATKAAIYLKPTAYKVPVWSQPNYNFVLYETMAYYHEKLGNYKEEVLYKDSLIQLRDSMSLIRDGKKLITLESSLQAEKFFTERKNLLLLASQERLKRNLIIGSLAALLAFVLYIFYRRRRSANELLNRANHQLAQYLTNIKDKNELIEKISNQLQETNSILAEEEKQSYMENLQKSVLLTEEQWAEFKHIFEQVFPYFFQLLAKKYPMLTAAEIRLMALEKLNLADKEMGNMLGISADSVRKTRYRLIKKHPELKGTDLH